MLKHIQTLCIGVGDGACYALSLTKVAERFLARDLDVLRAISEATEKKITIDDKEVKIIKFNWLAPTDNEAMYVNSPAGFLKMLTGRNWAVRREDATYKTDNPKEYIINSWGMSNAEGAPRHFTFDTDDTLYKSPLRTNGKLISVRVCRVED